MGSTVIRCKYCDNYMERVPLPRTPHTPFRLDKDALVCRHCDRYDPYPTPDDHDGQQ